MYDISQLNDMLVPELQDIAIQQNIPLPKKTDKQELISQILNNQSAMSNVENTDGEKPKRKRIRKPLTEPVSVEVPQPTVVEEKPKQEVRMKKPEAAPEKKKFIKKPIEPDPDDEEIEEGNVDKILEILITKWPR